MQQVTVEHIYPQYASTKVLFPERQRDGIDTLSDALNGEFRGGLYFLVAVELPPPCRSKQGEVGGVPVVITTILDSSLHVITLDCMTDMGQGMMG